MGKAEAGNRSEAKRSRSQSKSAQRCALTGIARHPFGGTSTIGKGIKPKRKAVATNAEFQLI